MGDQVTSDEMKLARDGQLSAGPARLRRVVEEGGGWRVRWLYRLANEYDEPNNPTERYFGGHRYILMDTFAVAEDIAPTPEQHGSVPPQSTGVTR